MRYAVLFIFVVLLSSGTKAQKTTENKAFIQFSGVVLDQDSLTPIPLVSILVKGTNRGAVSDFYGFFSMVISPGDELEFHSISYRKGSYKVADTLNQKYYYAIQVLARDTVQLQSVDVYPWPTREDFKRAFLALNLNETDIDRADRNLAREQMTLLERNGTTSASESYRYAMQAYYTKVYTTGQSPSFTLLNPVKWAEFIDAWRSGKFKNKTTTKKN